MNIEGIQLQEELPQKGINNSFLAIVFLVNNFGHKALDCKAYRKNYHKSVQGYGHKNNKSNSNQRSRNYNSFSPLQDYNVECYKCNNYGHKASNCRLLNLP
jgi:hypothetical protein